MRYAQNGCIVGFALLLTKTWCSDHVEESLAVDDCVGDHEVSLLQTGLALDGRADHLYQPKLAVHNTHHLSAATGLVVDASAASGSSALLQVMARQGVAAGLVVGLVIAGLAVLVLLGPPMWKEAMATDETVAFEVKKGPDSAGGPLGTGAEPPARPAIRTVLFFVVGHCLSASTLTVVNKWAMNNFHPPAVSGQHHGYVWTLSLIQFLFSAAGARLLGVLGVVRCEGLERKQALSYFPAAGMFMITIVAGNAVSNYSSVSTFVVLRSLVPIPCALLEIAIYKDALPPFLSWASLVLVVCGAMTYGSSMGGFELTVISWGIVFLVCMPVDGVLIKHFISSSSLSSWELVYYNNILASMPLVFYVFFFEVPNTQAFLDMLSALVSSEARVAVMVSCVVGISLSFFQMTTRYYISATAFMVLSVLNKFLTVLWSQVFIEVDHALPLVGVLLALCGAVAWQLSMGIDSVKVRPKMEVSQSTTTFAFLATIAGLLAAAFVQHTTMTGQAAS